MWGGNVADEISHAKFHLNRFRDFGSPGTGFAVFAVLSAISLTREGLGYRPTTCDFPQLSMFAIYIDVNAR